VATVIAQEQEPASDLIVRLRDCDAFGHLHNSRYIDYFLDAREDHLRRFYDFDLLEYGKRSGLGWVISKTQVRYLEPIRLGAPVRAITRLIGYDSRSLHVEGRLLVGTRLCAVLWTLFRAIDLSTGRPVEQNAEVMRLAEGIYAPLVGDPTFDERVASLPR